MYPSLVEPTIKVIMKQQLDICNQDKYNRNSILLNLASGAILVSIIAIILYINYKGKQDIKTIKDKERKKKEYILSKISYYQKMKSKYNEGI
jgi:hypothetical protein